MKKKIIAISIFIIYFLSSSISQTTFSLAVDQVNSVEHGVKLVDYKNNYYIVGLGTVWDSIHEDYRFRNYLSKIGKNQEVKKTVLLRQGFKSHALMIDNDTIYLQGTDSSLGSDSLIWNLYRFTIDGDSIDLHRYKDDYLPSGWIKSYVKGDYIYSAGKSARKNDKKGTEIVILKMTKSGGFVKENRFYEFVNPEYINTWVDLTPTADGNFAMSISYYGVPFVFHGDTYTGTDGYVSICKFNDNLDTIWTRQVSKSTDGLYDLNGRPLVSDTKDGGVYLSTSFSTFDSTSHSKRKEYYLSLSPFPLLFYRYDQKGNMIWTDTLVDYNEPGHSSGPIKTILDMKTARNGDLIGCGVYYNLYDEPKNQAWIFRYSADGKLKWQHSYVDREYYAYYSIFYDIEEAENGDLICVGGLKTDSIGEWYNTHYTWLLRVDSNGCYNPGCELADTLTYVLTDIEDLTTKGLARRIEIYPNPTHGMIHVNMPEGIKWQYWAIYDINGQKVKTGKIKTQDKITITGMQAIGKGIHFLMIKAADGKVGIGKFVVE